MKVISAAAQQNNGKDELCNYLAELLHELYGERWIRSAFANPVKDTFCEAFGVDRAFIEKWKRINEPPPGLLMPVRQGLQFIGDGFRKIKEKIWIEIALRGHANLIISDSRYVNEAEAVRGVGGLNILVYRPGFLNDDPNPSESQLRPLVEFALSKFEEGPLPFREDMLAAGAPEGLDQYDYFLVNGGTVADFRAKIKSKLVPWIAERLSLS
jgi:hypothetical protein